jgi:hypothetical protein
MATKRDGGVEGWRQSGGMVAKESDGLLSRGMVAK